MQSSPFRSHLCLSYRVHKEGMPPQHHELIAGEIPVHYLFVLLMLCPCRSATPLGNKRHERTKRYTTMSRLPSCAFLRSTINNPGTLVTTCLTEERIFSFFSRSLLHFNSFLPVAALQRKTASHAFPFVWLRQM